MRNVAVCCAAFAALTLAATASAQTIYVTNQATNVTDASVQDALPAFQAAVDLDFEPAWGARADLVFLPQDEVAPDGAATIAIQDDPDVYGAAGYHSVTQADVPYGKVFTRTPVNWQLVFTHELFEMLADPHIDRAVFLWPPFPWSVPGTFYLLEVGDPVERQRWAYSRPSLAGAPVVISDFVNERWYDCQGGKPLDYANHVKHCLHSLDGGYMTVFGDAARVRGRPAGIFYSKR